MTGLKAPGNYSDQFWSNKMLVFLWEGAKPDISMNYGLLDPWEPLSIDLDIPKYFKKYKKYGNLFEHIIFVNIKFGKSTKLKYWNRFGKDGCRTMMKIRLIKSRKSWTWDQSLPENMKLKFCKFMKPRNHKAINP